MGLFWAVEKCHHGALFSPWQATEKVSEVKDPLRAEVSESDTLTSCPYLPKGPQSTHHLGPSILPLSVRVHKGMGAGRRCLSLDRGKL